MLSRKKGSISSPSQQAGNIRTLDQCESKIKLHLLLSINVIGSLSINILMPQINGLLNFYLKSGVFCDNQLIGFPQRGREFHHLQVEYHQTYNRRREALTKGAMYKWRLLNFRDCWPLPMTAFIWFSNTSLPFRPLRIFGWNKQRKKTRLLSSTHSHRKVESCP